MRLSSQVERLHTGAEGANGCRSLGSPVFACATVNGHQHQTAHPHRAKEGYSAADEDGEEDEDEEDGEGEQQVVAIGIKRRR